MEGIVFDIQRFCVYDGPGIRTTVFLKGCNMRCKWCHNPESFHIRPQLMFHGDKCVSCEKCGVCPRGVHRFTGTGEHTLRREDCNACGICAGHCLHGALEISGKRVTADGVMDTIRKDGKYYRSSGGGVTFSGGEASVQPEFLMELLGRCKDEGYHVALETNGLVGKDLLRRLTGLVDLFLLDYKLTQERAHQNWTGVSGKAVLESLQLIGEQNGHVWLRCPIIPTVNDNDEHFERIKALQRDYTCIEKVEIMAYHDIGNSKWEDIGLPYTLAHLKTVPPETKRIWEEKISLSGNGRT